MVAWRPLPAPRQAGRLAGQANTYLGSHHVFGLPTMCLGTHFHIFSCVLPKEDHLFLEEVPIC